MTVKRTKLCYWRPAKPGVQSSRSRECKSSNTSRVRFTFISHTPMRSRFYHTHIMYKRNLEHFFLVNLIYFGLHIFQIHNLLHCVDESWWNTPFKETWLVTVWRTMLLLCCYHCDCMLQHYDVTQFECVLWRHTMHEWVMNIHLKTWIAQGRFTNIILTPSKQWGVCDKVQDCSNSSAIAMELPQSCAKPSIYLDTYMRVLFNHAIYTSQY